METDFCGKMETCAFNNLNGLHQYVNPRLVWHMHMNQVTIHILHHIYLYDAHVHRLIESHSSPLTTHTSISSHSSSTHLSNMILIGSQMVSSAVTFQRIRQQQRANGPATVLSIGTAVPPNCILQEEYADYYFRMTQLQSNHHAGLKEKLHKLCTCSIPYIWAFRLCF